MTLATVADRRLHPGTLLIRFVKQVPEFVVGLPAIIGFASDAGIGRILLIALTGASIAAMIAMLGWLRFRYGIGDREIVIESGILHRQRRVIPFDRIQDLDVERKLLARLLGLAKVKIETGGSANDEGSLDAVSLVEARRLRELIRHGQAGEAPGEEKASEPVLFRMSGRRLLLAGLFNFSLFYLAVIGGAFQYFDPLIDRVVERPANYWLPTREQAARYGVYVTLSLGLIILFLGVVTGLLRTVARNYRFRLSRVPNGFRRQRGLFTLSEVIIPVGRVQAAIVESGILRKRLGWWSLDFQTLSADAHQSGQQDAAPFARMDEILPILRESGLDALPDESDYRCVARRTIVRRCVSKIVPLLCVTIAVGLFVPAALLLLLPLVAAAVGVALFWRRHRYAFGESALFVQEGLLRPRLWIMPFANLHSVSVRAGPLQRKLGLATVEIDTAGASVFRPLTIRDIDTDESRTVAMHLLSELRRFRRSRPRSNA